ncbi:MAG: aminotransferase class I/II-fold pyridoxal phosphate-dependent enzyme [Oscillospiraceae bacterium]|nr:aminotransferase class I/II-fold pyridoxal phosphate-dependent enzyme [Oscillospiraceae bacterium]
MTGYRSLSKEERAEELKALQAQYEKAREKGYQLDMSRGKPAPVQLDLSMGLLEEAPETLVHSRKGADVRNYGELAGLDEARELFAQILGLRVENIIMGGQASLALMYDCIIKAWVFGVYGGSKPWSAQGKVKFLCPVPGYDRHFRITQEFGFEMINIPMSPAGPDMAMVRNYVENDASVKGIWCVPKYSNPQGYTYSAETVEAFAALKPAADDFRIFWDNAYVVHGFREEDDELANIFDLCEKYGSTDMVYEFASTSKVTFPGAGISAIGASKNNVSFLLKQMGVQTISYDKINQLRHANYFPNGLADVNAHMKKQAEIIRPKFDIVLETLADELDGLEIGTWTKPNGGYFVCFEGLKGTAKRCVQLCADAGVKLTGAGAPFPYGIDPEDSTIRIAPTYPTPEQLKESIRIFCLCQRIAALEVLG